MTPEQLERLAAITEKVTDEALDAMDPAKWPGADVPVEKWTAQIRGDRVWQVKNANAAVSLLLNLRRLTEGEGGPGGGATTPGCPPEETEEEKVERAEAAAKKLLDGVKKRATATR